MPLDVTQSGCIWNVCHNGARIQGPFGSKGRAEDALDALQNNPSCKLRACMTCQTEFLSEGPHNRMCNRCRKNARAEYTTDVTV